jgi:hypothetical protein
VDFVFELGVWLILSAVQSFVYFGILGFIC